LLLDRTVFTTVVNLQRIGVVRAAFECRSCTFTAGINARHVVFERELDLGGAEVRGPLDFDSASFAGSFVLGSVERRTRVFGRANFRLASFGDVADFEQVLFRQDVDFSLARFRGEAVFAGAELEGATSFAGDSFDDRARFEAGSFGGRADFTRAVFGSTADFRTRTFIRPSQFDAVDFRGIADFGQATFDGVPEFDRSRFEQNATFRGATFTGTADPGDDRALSMNYVVAQQGLDFGSAMLAKLALAENVVARSLSFDDVAFVEPARISLASLKVEDLRYPLDDVVYIVEDTQQRDVLRQIESSAKNRGDIGLANDAHYRLQKLAARNYGTVRRVADAVFYRGIAGYFVRPLRPLAVLVALVLALSLLRWFSRSGSGTATAVRRGRASLARFGVRRSDKRAPGRTRRTWGWHTGFASELFDTFGLVLPRLRGGDEQAGSPAARPARRHGMGRRLEILAYRVLLVCALLGLANSNPTLRQMFDALL
jgi:uncharacterized protein YjbI with pentapeptide repeats